MADSFIRTSGTEVFNGNKLALRSQKLNWNFDRLTEAPPLTAAWRFPEIQSNGIKAPLLTIDGLFDASVSHGTNETGSTVDWHFLNELVMASGPKYFTDDYMKPTTGSELLVEIINLNIPFDARQTSAADVRSETQKYTMRLYVASGTVLWSGTGILDRG